MGEWINEDDKKSILKWWDDKKIDEEYEDEYGDGIRDYVVYALLDNSKSGIYNHGPLKFQAEPFYIGHGKKGRPKSSATFNILNWQTRKNRRLDKIYRSKNSVCMMIIGRFQTKVKAKLVERKILNIIPRDSLTNATFPDCNLDLLKNDYSTLTEYWLRKEGKLKVPLLKATPKFELQKNKGKKYVLVYEENEVLYNIDFETLTGATRYSNYLVKESLDKKSFSGIDRNSIFIIESICVYRPAIGI